MVIVEVAHGVPYVLGDPNGVHVSEVDYIIEGDHQPLAELPNLPATDADRAVARLDHRRNRGWRLPADRHRRHAQRGLQPVGGERRSRPRHPHRDADRRDHRPLQGRIVTGARKTLNPGKLVCTFALGSRYIYDAITRNPDILCCPVDYTNLPHMIMQNDRVVAINNTTQIDLQGQAASESDGHRHLSGTGGQPQFVRGAYASKGGKSFICLASTYDKRGERRSRIVLSLTPGNIVTTPRSDMMYVVTEYGMVNLKGKSVAERALALISIAHPDFREGLEREAYEKRLIPRGFSF